ncbi:MAG: nodulation protein NfeD [Elusimicrobia bacterium]|nr:nodulation protein NfeD [Elusimicrobiota bacterium]
MRSVPVVYALFFAAALSSAAPAPSKAPVPRVLLSSYSGVINPAAAEFLQGGVARAEQGEYDALIIELDTPGGLDLSMREIVKTIMSSRVPVLVYVSPAGARATSAGVFITMAAHVAAMAPGTNIGAAHPVELGGGGGPGKEKPSAVLEDKITNDASAYLQAIAHRRGRNEQWAFLVVSKSTSVTSGEAVRLRVVDLEAKSLEELLSAADGKRLPDFPKPLRLKGAAIERLKMTQRQKILAAVSDPNVAMILMTLGVSGLLIELYSPGLILPGIVGVVSLILAFYSFQTLSVNYAGLLLMGLGLVLFLLELKITSFGLLALSGAAAVLFGAMMLFKNGTGGVAVSPALILSMVGLMVSIAAVLLYVVGQALRRKATIGMESLAGAKGVAATALDPEGQVRLQGELWAARSAAGRIEEGSEIEVLSAEGLTLRVRPKA